MNIVVVTVSLNSSIAWEGVCGGTLLESVFRRVVSHKARGGGTQQQPQRKGHKFKAILSATVSFKTSWGNPVWDRRGGACL